MEREKGEDIAEISKGFIAYQAKGIVDVEVIYCKSSEISLCIARGKCLK